MRRLRGSWEVPGRFAAEPEFTIQTGEERSTLNQVSRCDIEWITRWLPRNEA